VHRGRRFKLAALPLLLRVSAERRRGGYIAAPLHTWKRGVKEREGGRETKSPLRYVARGVSPGLPFSVCLFCFVFLLLRVWNSTYVYFCYFCNCFPNSSVIFNIHIEVRVAAHTNRKTKQKMIVFA
jgi:hypothetical protein